MTIEHHEYVLQQVVDVGGAGAEALQRSVEVVDLSLESVQAVTSGLGGL
jgi:hypothetical protein